MGQRARIEAFGEIKSISEWIRDPRVSPGLTKGALIYRLKIGQGAEEAITKHQHKYQYNHDYFKEWTYENAWIIGFITADGNVRNNILNIQLAQKDTHILEHIRDQISPSCAISLRKEINHFDPISTSYKAILRMSSSKIVADLIKYNIFPRKTGKEKLPNFPNRGIAYRYLLGIIDGDGTIGCYKVKNKPRQHDRKVAIYSSSFSFLEQIKEYFNIGHISKQKGRNCHVLSIRSKHQLIDLYYNLYDSGGFCLQRKMDKYTEIMTSYYNAGDI